MISSRASVWRFTERQLTSADSVPRASEFCLLSTRGDLLPRCGSETAEVPTSVLGDDALMWRYMVNLRLTLSSWIVAAPGPVAAAWAA